MYESYSTSEYNNLFKDNLFDNTNVDLYKVLNICYDATDKDIKNAYRRLILKYHPDKNKYSNSSDEFLKIKYAYDILCDNAKKKIYDNVFFGKNNIKNHNIKNHNHWNFSFNNITHKMVNFISETDIDKLILMGTNRNMLEKFKSNFGILMTELDDNFIKSLVNIEIKIGYGIKEIWECVEKKVCYKKISGEIFEETIFPIDMKQIYTGEGENIKINGKQYCGDVILTIEMIDNEYNGEKYFIYNNSLHILINEKRIIDNKFVVNFLDENKYKFNLTKLQKITNELGTLWVKKNFGLVRTNNTIEHYESFIHGNLFFIIVL